MLGSKTELLAVVQLWQKPFARSETKKNFCSSRHKCKHTREIYHCNMLNKKKKKQNAAYLHWYTVWPVVDVPPLTIAMKDDQICGTETGSPLHISSEDLWGKWKVEITCTGNRMRLSVHRAYFTQWDGQPSKARIISVCCFPCVLKGVRRGFLCRKAALQCFHPLFANQPGFAERDPGCTETTLSSRRPENPSAVTQEELETGGRWKLG